MNIMTKRGQLDNIITYQHICDTNSDIPNIPSDQITLGSVCIVLQGESGGLQVYIANSQKQWQSITTGISGGSGGGEGSLQLYICDANEYNNQTNIPTVVTPNNSTIYLVPTNNENDLYAEWIYVNNSWERFGNTAINLSNYALLSNIPSNVSELTNDAGYLTQHQDISNKADKTDTILNTTLSRGRKANTTIGEGSFAFGINTTADGAYSHAQGNNTSAARDCSHAEGIYTQAHGYYSHAEGYGTMAYNTCSHAEGSSTIASASCSHAEGQGTSANGVNSHAEGAYTEVSGACSHVEGVTTIASGYAQHVQGQYNIEDLNNKYADIIGIGTYDNARANGYTLDWDGNGWYAGKVTVGNTTPTENGDLTSKAYVDAAINNINTVLNNAPTEAVGESILQTLSEENTILNLLKSVVNKYIAQQDVKEDGIRIPEYFKENVETAIVNYRKNAEEVGHDGDSFVFITDVHWGVNTKNSPALIKYILSKTSLRNVICGGDILDSGSKASELAKGYDFMAQFADIPGGLKTVIGNHDFNKNGHTDDSSYWFTLAQTYALFYPKAGMEMQDVQCIEPATGYYEISYCVDVPATNTRFMFVSIPFGSVYQVTKDWVLAQLTDNPTKNFVIFSHFLMKNAQGEMAGGASGLMNAVKDFANLKAWIFGHTHIDQVYYMSTGIPMISTDTDSSRLATENPNSYTPGTITEQAFDLMTVGYTGDFVECARVGRGKNRRINAGVNEVNIAGSLALTSTITPTAWESSDTAVATVANGTVTGVASGSAIIKASNADKEEYWYIKVN